MEGLNMTKTFATTLIEIMLFDLSPQTVINNYLCIRTVETNQTRNYCE